MGGQSKSQTIGYDYAVGVHQIFHRGTADFISRITFDNVSTEAWSGNQTANGTISINKPKLFGDQGGVVGSIDYMNGNPSQTPNTYLTNLLGSYLPAYRNVTGLVWNRLTIGRNPYLKTLGLEGCRIHIRETVDGTNQRTQWYDAKSAIPDVSNPLYLQFYAPTDTQKWRRFYANNWANSSVVHNETVSLDDHIAGNNWVTTYQLPQSSVYSANDPVWNEDFQNWFRKHINLAVATSVTFTYSAYCHSTIWIDAVQQVDIPDTTDSRHAVTGTFTVNLAAGDHVIAIMAKGTRTAIAKESGAGGDYVFGCIQTGSARNYATKIACANDVLAYYVNNNPGNSYTLEYIDDTLPADFPNGANARMHYVRASDGSTGTQDNYIQGYSTNPTNTIDCQLKTGGSSNNQYDINPVHFIRESFTEPWGDAFSESLFPDAVWQAAADQVYNEGLGVSLSYDSQSSIEDFRAILQKHINAECYKDRRDGMWKIKLIRNDYDPSTLITLNKSNISAISNFNKPVFGKLVNAVTVNYTDVNSGFVDATLTVQDIAMASMQGKYIVVNQDYKAFTNATVASQVAQRDLKTLSTSLISVTIETNLVAQDLNKGSVFKWTWSDYGITDLVMRVTGISFGDGRSNKIIIDCVQDIFALPTNAIVSTTSGTAWTPQYSAPTALTRRLVFEAPYLELVQAIGQATIDNQLSADSNSSYIAAAIGRQANATRAEMWDEISTYSKVGSVDFCPTAILNQALTISGDYTGTSFAINSGSDLSLVVVGVWFQIDSELFCVKSITDAAITAKRGCLDTIPAAHSSGSLIYFWDNYALIDATEYVTGNMVSVKMLTVNPVGTLSLSDASVDVVTMAGRAAKPYNMANVKLNGAYYPSSVTGDLVLTWANRNRLSQTSSTIYGFVDGNITPESGVTYNITLIDADDLSTALSLTGVTGTTNTITAATMMPMGGSLILKIQAVRGGIISYQSYSIPFTNLNSKRRITTANAYRVTTTGAYRTVI